MSPNGHKIFDITEIKPGKRFVPNEVTEKNLLISYEYPNSECYARGEQKYIKPLNILYSKFSLLKKTVPNFQIVLIKSVNASISLLCLF